MAEDGKPKKRDEAARAWLHYGDAYFYDAALLHREEKPDRGFFNAPVAYLYFHAIELYLKSFLRHHGVSEEKLGSQKFGHQLAKLLKHCRKRGLPRIKRLEDICERAVLYDQPIRARYITTGWAVSPKLTAQHEACWKLRTLVARELEPVVTINELPKMPVVHPEVLSFKQALRRMERIEE
ncbi:hypothetical protein ABEG18_14680 [Alsobacter sp. KACC 23698]|uniref:HEPN domain-containing protein n=1 Tax=Alsobacter sp. KACC 23698 TaxID=3149229 RepID=A0AAU7J9E1_9HYPH